MKNIPAQPAQPAQPVQPQVPKTELELLIEWFWTALVLMFLGFIVLAITVLLLFFVQSNWNSMIMKLHETRIWAGFTSPVTLEGEFIPASPLPEGQFEQDRLFVVDIQNASPQPYTVTVVIMAEKQLQLFEHPQRILPQEISSDNRTITVTNVLLARKQPHGDPSSRYIHVGVKQNNQYPINAGDYGLEVQIHTPDDIVAPEPNTFSITIVREE